MLTDFEKTKTNTEYYSVIESRGGKSKEQRCLKRLDAGGSGPWGLVSGRAESPARGGVGVGEAAGLVVRVGVDLVWRVYMVDVDSFRSLEWRVVGVRN